MRAATFKPLTWARALISSSARPSQRYSWSCWALMSLNGKTAMDVMHSRSPGESVAVLGSTVSAELGVSPLANTVSAATNSSAL